VAEEGQGCAFCLEQEPYVFLKERRMEDELQSWTRVPCCATCFQHQEETGKIPFVFDVVQMQ
jgi:hypothetical protein